MQAIPADDLFSSLEFQLSLMRLSSALESRQPSHSAPDRQLEQLLRQQMYLDRA